jgi:hypothetical protein
MKIKMNDVLMFMDSQNSARYGTGVVSSVTHEECIILWSGRGLTKYKRSILDGKLADLFQLVDIQADLPRARQLKLGAAKASVSFNENYDREKVVSLCAKLKLSGAQKAKDVADGVVAKLLKKKFTLREQTRAMLCQLAQLCDTRSAASDDAQHISKELFFGYVLRESDFQALEPDK